MHKFIPVTTTTEAAFEQTKKGLRANHRAFVVTHADEINDAYENYLTHTNPCELEQLSPIWDSDTGETMNKLYDSKEAFKEAYKDELIKLNGKHALKCPICGVVQCKHLDHYIPREKMPEFSVFTPNLIPTCADCNSEKGTAWKNAQGERIIFNAFYDQLPNKPICICTISLDSHGLPQASIGLNPLLDANNPVDRRIINTEKELKLINRVWQEECDAVFKAELSRLVDDYDIVQWPNPEDYWTYKSARIPNYQKDSIHTSFIARLVYESIGQSVVIKNWLVTQLKLTK